MGESREGVAKAASGAIIFRYERAQDLKLDEDRKRIEALVAQWCGLEPPKYPEVCGKLLGAP